MRYERHSEWREGGAAKSARTFHVGAYEETLPESDAAVASVQRTRLPGGAVHVKTTPAQGTATATFEYRHLDHLGSAAAVSDGTGAALAVLGHDPFGARRRPDWTRGLTAAESAALPRRAARGFTGHEHLDRTGLVHTGGRLYDPVLGRFLSADPYVSEPDTGQGWNRYAYVSNSPLSRTDPSGHVQAGAWCQIAHAMCAEADGGGGFGRESRTYRVPALAVVHVPYVRAGWSLVYGRGPFGDGGWLRFVPRFVWGWRSLAIPYMATGAVQVEGESPADEPMGQPGGASSGGAGVWGAAARRLEQALRNYRVLPPLGWIGPGGYSENMVAPGYHVYAHTSPEICRVVQPGCTRENIVDAINAVGAHPNQSRAFVPGERYVGDVDLPVFVGRDDVTVRSVYDGRGSQVGVLNTTMLNHGLFPGRVLRRTVVVDGGYRIRTSATGYGWFGYPNVLGSYLVGWGEVDRRVIDHVRAGIPP